MTYYLESSAAAKLLVTEAQTPALTGFLQAASADECRIQSAALLETELRLLAVRRGFAQADVTVIIERLEIIDIDRACFRQAGLLPGESLRSLDAIHVAAALRGGADAMITYDRRQADAARAVGLAVVAPS